MGPRCFYYTLIGLTYLLSTAQSVQAKKLAIEPPVTQPAVSTLIQAPPSQIAVELNIPLANLQAALNSRLPSRLQGVVADPSDLVTEDTLEWSITLGTISLHPAGNAVKFSLPMQAAEARLQGRMGVKRKNDGLLGKLEEAAGFTFSETAHFAGTVTGLIQLDVTPDWTLAPILQASVKLSQAEAQLFGKAITVSFRGAIQDRVDQAMARLSTDLREQLASSNALRETVQQAWEDIYALKQVSAQPRTWLTLEPSALGLGTPQLDKQTLTVVVQALVESAVIIADKAPTLSKQALPAPMPMPSTTQGLHLLIPLAVKLSDFQAVSPDVLGLPTHIDVSGGQLKLQQLALQGQGGQLYLKATLEAQLGWFKSIEATVYIAAQAVLDTTNNELYLEQLDYDLRTKNALLKTADTLLKPTVLSELAERSRFSLEPTTAELLAQAQAKLDELEADLPSGLNADFNLFNSQVKQLVVADNWLILLVEAEGVATMQFDASALKP